MFQTCRVLCKKCAPWGLTVLRILLGLILISHGWIKFFGDQTELLVFFESTVLPFPEFMMNLAGVLELGGGIMLILGLFVFNVSLLLALEWVVILFFVRLEMNGWFGTELDLLIFASLFALSCLGGGMVSLDEMIKEWKAERKGQKMSKLKHAK